MPFFLPWIGLLLLILPKKNRVPQVSWLLLPLGFFLLISIGAAAMSLLVNAGPTDVLAQFIVGLASGQAAIWLLSPYLKGRNRITVFLGILLISEAFAAGSMALLPDRDHEPLLSIATFALIVAFALSLAGSCCRKAYNWLRFSGWTILWITVGWVVTLIVWSIARTHFSWGEAILLIVIFAPLTFALMLPFLIVTFANPFFRARLMDLFAMQPAPSTPAPSAPVATPPPVLPAAPPPVAPTPVNPSDTQPQP